jgi:hypothetical protein
VPSTDDPQFVKHHASIFLIATAYFLLRASFGHSASLGIVHGPMEGQDVPRLAAKKA